MSAAVIVSYDGTPNDDDGLVLGRLLAQGETTLALAYVRHSQEFDPGRETLAQHDAERRLEQGAARLGDPGIPSYVVLAGSTGAGLEELAVEQDAAVIVFGSDYRTPPRHAEPPASAQRMLEIGTVAIAVAAAGLRAEPNPKIESILVFAEEDDDAAPRTAEALSAKLGARIAAPGATDADLIVVGSKRGAPGRLALSGAARTMLDATLGSVLVVPSGDPLLL